METTYKHTNMTNKTITYNQYNHIIGEHERIRGLGITLIPNRDILTITIGVALVGIGIITLPLPTGSLIMIPLGCLIMARGGIDMGRHIRTIQRKIRYKLGGILW